MGLFKRKDHYEYENEVNKEIELTRYEHLYEWIPTFQTSEHCSIYGGDNHARSFGVLKAIANCYGNMGVVVIHNNDLLAQLIEDFYAYHPRTCEHAEYYGKNVKKCFVNKDNLDYEPLYGLSEDRAIEAIYPQSSRDDPSYMQKALCAEALRSYITILRSKGEDIDLDGLYYLVNLELPELKEHEMTNLNEYECRRVMNSLTQHNNIYLQVRVDVNAFARGLRGRIWRERYEGEDSSDISMIEAVRHNAILSIKVPSDRGVLDYLYAEIKAMVDEGLKFLLVIDSVCIANSKLNTELMRLPSLPFSTVTAGDSIQGIYTNSDDMMYSLEKMSKVVIMQCNNVSAKIYSEIVGQYMRNFVSTHMGKNKEAFKWFGNVEHAQDIHQELFSRILPEEFTRLYPGAVLIDQSTYDNRIVKTDELVIG